MGSRSKRIRKIQDYDSDIEDDIYTNELPVIEEEEEEEEEEEDEMEEEGEEEDLEELNDGVRVVVNDVIRKNVGPNEELEELEKEFRNLRHQEQDLLKNLKNHKDEDFLKGQAVKNQRVLWDKTLELRFLLQKAFSNSNRLPPNSVRSSFLDLDEGVNLAYSNLVSSSVKTLNSLLELQMALHEKNPSIIQASKGDLEQTFKRSDALTDENLDEEWIRVLEMHSKFAPFRDRSVDKWQRKTQVTTGAAAIKGKLHAFNQNISEQVRTYMRDPSRMMKGMQLMRSLVQIYGVDPVDVENFMAEGAKVDGDPELLDDGEFYQQLLKEFFETIDPASSEAALYSLKRLENKKRKIVDRRASKSRKIRYNIHDKIVNFMAPRSIKLPPMAPKLFADLFGLKTKRPTASEIFQPEL